MSVLSSLAHLIFAELDQWFGCFSVLVVLLAFDLFLCTWHWRKFGFGFGPKWHNDWGFWYHQARYYFSEADKSDLASLHFAVFIVQCLVFCVVVSSFDAFALLRNLLFYSIMWFHTLASQFLDFSFSFLTKSLLDSYSCA